jgi:predicted HicB family RNase H-like nuclease
VKRIIDGKTYNTDTSTLIARYEYEDDKGYDTTANIYQNRNGAFFIVHEWSEETIKSWNDIEKMEWDQKVMKYYFEASSREEIAQLVARQDNIEILDERALAVPPEAEEETEPAATAYLRLPVALKNRIEAAARKDGLSLNSWAIRCFENCAGREATA